jgi:hypothetical protein
VSIRSKPSTPEYRAGWDQTFGPRRVTARALTDAINAAMRETMPEDPSKALVYPGRLLRASSKASEALAYDGRAGKQREKNGARLTGGHA